MDCVRVSTRELKDEEYMGKYNKYILPHKSDLDSCRQKCVSNLSCKAWKYTPERDCYLSYDLYGHYPMYRIAKEGTRSGLIECKNSWNMLKLIWLIVVLGFVLFMVWYLMNKGEIRKGKGETFFPRFYFTGP